MILSENSKQKIDSLTPQEFRKYLAKLVELGDWELLKVISKYRNESNGKTQTSL